MSYEGDLMKEQERLNREYEDSQPPLHEVIAEAAESLIGGALEAAGVGSGRDDDDSDGMST